MAGRKRRYPHLASKVLGTPLMIEPRKLEAWLAVLGPRFEIDPEQIEQLRAEGAPTEAKDRRPYMVTDAGVAVIDVMGSLVHRAMGLDALSGLSSYQQIGAELALAIADDAVKSIVLRCDSPGGEVSGAFDLAAAVANCPKPTFSIAEDMACSAAYLIASAADKCFVTQSAIAGSIGVILTHTDYTDAERQAGMRVSYLFAGAHKADGARPLDAEHRAAIDALQAEVDKYYELFVSAVAQARGISAATVRATEARCFVGADAVAAGLADGVATFEEVVGAATPMPEPPPEPEIDVFILKQDRPAPNARVSVSAPTAVAAANVVDMNEAEFKAIVDSKIESALAPFKTEIAALKAEIAAKDAALAAHETARKTEVISKHEARGAIVPAMKASVLALAETCKTAEDLDAKLSGFPVVLHTKPAPSAQSTVETPAAEGTPEQKIEAIAREIQKQNPGMKAHSARTLAWERNPDLYRAYRTAHNQAHRRP